MPFIFDNIAKNSQLLPALQNILDISSQADFCVGYFNLRGWGGLAPYVNRWNDESKGPCRVLIGMQKHPHDELKDALTLTNRSIEVDSKTAIQYKRKLAEQFRQQLIIGAPTNNDEHTLQQLAVQLRTKKVVVKLFLRHPLHAKLYLLYRNDPATPIVGYLGSSNLTLAGLVKQGELNIDVQDQDAAGKLKNWFEQRWGDNFCIDITDELAQIIEESWARSKLVLPYHIYLKMAYHLSNEARSGLAEYTIPKIFGNQLFEFQTAAVKIAARYLYRRNGVLIGDVVGLGKTLMATAVARIFEDDYNMKTLIICPKNLVDMWDDYVYRYELRAKIIPLSKVQSELPNLRRYHLVIIDESHNLRNRKGKRYRVIQEYVRANDSKCILLSATPYNKTYHDLSNQLRIFIEDDHDLGIRPEKLLREQGEIEFSSRHQTSPRTLAAFEFSEYADDWRELMSLYMIRRTRSFIQDNYANIDHSTGRKFITYEDGRKSYFPTRVPKTVKFEMTDSDSSDQYARLYSANVVDAIDLLKLPRYGLGNYVSDLLPDTLTHEESIQVQNLSKAGQRLMGFCRTNLFKRLESSGMAFLLSIKRHLLRNYVFLHAINNGLPIPIGSQDAELLDSRINDEDDILHDTIDIEDDISNDVIDNEIDDLDLKINDLKTNAAKIYADYQNLYQSRFRWLRPDVFTGELADDILADAEILLEILQTYGDWQHQKDVKLNALYKLLTETYPDSKVLIFSQFADTVSYIEEQLNVRGLKNMASVTGNSVKPTEFARRFSPDSNQARDNITKELELRVLIATDILSEGQNLQDCHVVVNYDLPWAIIRLIQRVGRVDRIGQTADKIFCHSFLPAEGIDHIINLRNRVRTRLGQNAAVVGTDEAFFEDEIDEQTILDLYNERTDILDEDDDDSDVDLGSQAYQIWKNAISTDPKLEKIVTGLSDVAFSSRQHIPTKQKPEGVLMFIRTVDDNNALAYVDKKGKSITESQLEILSMAECKPDTPAQIRHESHHNLVESGVKYIAREEQKIGGELGRSSGARYRVYTRLKIYVDSIKESLIDIPTLRLALQDIYRYPLRSLALDTLNRHLRIGADDESLALMVIDMQNEDRLCQTDDQNSEIQEPRIVCSLGLFNTSGRK